MSQSIIPADPSQADQSIVNLMYGLKQEESGGNYTQLGDKNKSGAATAAGVGQWSNQVNGKPVALAQGQIPTDFQSDAKQFGLDPTDFSPANQNKVMYAVLAKDKATGLSPEQALSKWNSGSPNAYASANSSGTGPVGNYNVAKYVSSAMGYAQKYAQKNGKSGTDGGAGIGNLPSAYGGNTPLPITQTNNDVASQRASLEAQGQPVSVNQNKAAPTLGGSLLRGLISPLVRLGNTAVEGVQKLTGTNPTQQQEYSQYLGDISGYGMKANQTTGQRLKDIAGGILENGALAIPGFGEGADVAITGGEAAAKAGTDFVVNSAGEAMPATEGILSKIPQTLGQKIGSGATQGAIMGGMVGAGNTLDTNPNANIGDVLKNGVIGAASGAILGGATNGVLGKISGTPSVGALSNDAATQAKGAILDSIDGTSWGIKARANPTAMGALDNAVESGYAPELSADGKRFDNTQVLQDIRQPISQLQAQKAQLLEQATTPIDKNLVRNNAINYVLQNNPDKQSQKEIIAGINDFFDNNANVSNKQFLTAKDMFNLQNLESVTGDAKFAGNPDKAINNRAQTARAVYGGLRSSLHAISPELVDIDDTLSKFHNTEKLLGNKGLNGKTVKSGQAVSFLRRVGMKSARAVGAGLGSVFGGPLGSIVGDNIGDHAEGLFTPKSPLAKDAYTAAINGLRKNTAAKVAGMIKP